MWDSVPWFIGGQAEHSPQVARLLAYAAFGGKQGIVGTRDCQVRELSVPGDRVRVMPGAVSILNRAAGAEYESYAGRLPTQDEVEIAPTGAGETRYDMIAAVVKNPYQPGETWPIPTDRAVGPYIETMVLPNVPSTAETIAQAGYNYSGIALARVRIPQLTGTIDSSMITDLRKLVAPRQLTIQRIMNLRDSSNPDTLNTNSMRPWPAQATWNHRIPEWATMAQVVGIVSGARLIDVAATGGGWAGQVRIQHGELYTEPVEINLDVIGGGGDIQSAGAVMAAGDLAVPSDHRDTVRDLSFQGELGSANGCKLHADWGTAVWIQVTYYEEPELQGWEN